MTSVKSPGGSTVPGQAAPSVTSHPTSQTTTVGQTATFSVIASGTAPLGYQWRKNGTSIIGATSATYTTAPTTMSDNGSLFTVIISNSVGSVTSNPASLTVNAAAVAPSITTQPASQAVTAGQTALFSVAASGTAPLTYQWRKNGTAISGAASANYTIPATAPSDSGSQFTVVVSNGAGSATSNAATLTVSAQTQSVRFADQFCATPGILDQSCIQNALNALPSGATLVIPQTASGSTYIINSQLLYAPTLSSGFVYGPDIECQNGVVLDDRVSNNSMLLIKSVSPNKFLVGVHVRNCEILTTTNPAASNGIEMQQVWNCSIDNVSVHGLSGDGIRLSDAGGDAAATQLISLNDNHIYANGGWGVNLNSTKGIPTVDGIDFTRNLITGNTAGGVRAPVVRTSTFRDNSIAFNAGPGVHFQTNGGCSNLSELFLGGSFDNNGGGHIKFDCGYGLVVEGVEFDFSVCCGFSTPFGIQVGNPIEVPTGGARGADIRANYFNINQTNSGFIGINFTSNAGQSIAENNVFTPLAVGQLAYVNIYPYTPTNYGNLVYPVGAASLAPLITTQPVSQTVPVGQTVTFSVGASGTVPLTYHWAKNGVAISGATTSTYVLPYTTTSDNGALFTVVVSNGAGSASSNAATLTVSAQTQSVRFADQFCATPGILDQSCIQNALNALPSGATLVIPQTASGSTYIINSQLLYAPTLSSGFVYGPDIECQNGVVLDDRVSNNSMLLIKSVSPNKFLAGVHVRNCEILTTTNPAASNGIEMQQVWNSSIDNVSVHGLSGDGIRLSDAGGGAGATQGISLNDNHIYFMGGWGVNLNTTTGNPAIGGINFTRNLITGNTAGGIRAAAINGTTFQNNSIAFNGGPGVHFQANGGCSNLSELFQGGSFDNNGGGHIKFDCGDGLVVEGVEFDFSVCCGFSTPFGIQVGNPVEVPTEGASGADIRASFFRVNETNSGFIGINFTSNASKSSAENTNVFSPLASGQLAYLNSNPRSSTNPNGDVVDLPF